MEKLAIFGCGHLGLKALEEEGKENVICFIDNNIEKQGSLVGEIPVVSLEAWSIKYSYSKIVIATIEFEEIIQQLKENKINKYEVWFPRYNHFCETDEIVMNPYEKRRVNLNENEINLDDRRREIDIINKMTDVLWKKTPLFNHIEIETYNRCNGGCDFCPVSKKNDSREEKIMSEYLFEKIINELSEMKYRGCLALFSNNEPFLDERIIDFSKVVKKRVPFARTHLFTNGTLLSIDKFIQIIDYLDELIIDNYNEKLELIPNCKEIRNYCEKYPELCKKVTIVIRSPREVLEARGGMAPNRSRLQTLQDVKCTHPFRQLIIRPDGKVSICCNDALGVTDLGDVSKETLLDVWNGEKIKKIREKLAYEGRKNIDICKYCDSLRIV